MKKIIIKPIVLILCLTLLTSCSSTSNNQNTAPDPKNDKYGLMKTSVKLLMDKYQQEHDFKTPPELKALLKHPDENLTAMKMKTVHFGDTPINYIDHDTFFLADGESQETTGRYANKSDDGLVNFNPSSPQRLGDNIVAKEMIKKATLNGNRISLPMKFKKLGEEFAAFDDINFKAINKDTNEVLIKNNKNGYLLFILMTPSEYNKDDIILNISDADLNFLVSVRVNRNSGFITGILSSSGTVREDLNDKEEIVVISPLELKLDGLGAGNTLKEFYEKFGLPSAISKDSSLMLFMGYIFIDTANNLSYTVLLHTDEKVYDSRTQTEKRIRNNTVTSVDIVVELQ